MEHSSFKDCRESMAKHFAADEGLRIGYIANVAMLLHDNGFVVDYDARDKAARMILTLLFDADFGSPTL